ncbi:LOW QUALITY PROTEIN: hypothetical protein OSB04_002411 [Centaurea solstitialis]|uniref:hAT-like transposase RNase-H fold domain-containing protein n=1 Tax=Centaurea solstitialis TaxID=347529 RepID=A0AA38TSY8_9ASTR|nr:LOW QUALITY PROTEIN: hypothetical protein OSB04_002411 [Centaurea solstitialis]
MPTEEGWDFARCLLPLLRGFYTSTLRISGSLYVTSKSYFHELFGIRAMIKKIRCLDEGLRKMATRMKGKYDKYWSNESNINIFLFVGPILDPRHKLGYVSFIVEQNYEKEKVEWLCHEIEKVLKGLFNHYSREVE